QCPCSGIHQLFLVSAASAAENIGKSSHEILYHIYTGNYFPKDNALVFQNGSSLHRWCRCDNHALSLLSDLLFSQTALNQSYKCLERLLLILTFAYKFNLISALHARSQNTQYTLGVRGSSAECKCDQRFIFNCLLA